MTRLLLCLLTVAALVGGLAAPATAAPNTGTIKGTITVPSPFHAYEVRVYAHPEDGSEEIAAYRSDAGTYTLDLEPGRYKIEFDHSSDLGDPVRDEWHPDQSTEAAASWVTVTAGGTQTIDASLEKSTGLGTITGKVTWPNGTPAHLALIYIFRPRSGGGFDATFQETGPDGTFTYQLKPGTYRLEFNPGHNYLVPEFWREQQSAAGPTPATPVVVTSGSSLTADAQLACPSTCATASITADGGTPTVGRTLTASSQGWELEEPLDPALPQTLSYVWMRDGAEIAGATARTYTPTAADLGKRISVRLVENGWMGPYPDITKTITSLPTAPIAAGTLTAPTPTISGTAAVGSTLTANPGTWAPAGVTLSFQWLRDGAEIDGATAATYTATAADGGRTLSVRVTGTLPGHNTASSTSSGVLVAAQVVTGANPRITGTARVGRVLTASTAWTPSNAATTYQWLRDGTAIARATGRTYTLTRSDVGRTISVRVVGSRPDHASATRTSSGVKVAPAVSAIAVKAKGGKRTAVFTVRVSAAGVTPTGVVRVKLGSRKVKSATLRNGRAVLKAKRLPKGKRTFTVSYLGRDGVAGSAKRMRVTIR